MSRLIPARWFGAKWNAPICGENPPVATPIGEPCAYCDRPIGAGDRGVIWAHSKPNEAARDRPFHFACLWKLSDIILEDEWDRLMPDD